MGFLARIGHGRPHVTIPSPCSNEFEFLIPPKSGTAVVRLRLVLPVALRSGTLLLKLRNELRIRSVLRKGRRLEEEAVGRS